MRHAVTLIGASATAARGLLGYFDEGGRLWMCGRRSQRVQARGGPVFTEQVEPIFNTHPQVFLADAFVFLTADAGFEFDHQHGLFGAVTNEQRNRHEADSCRADQ